jgi:hypothetical protein
MHIYVHMIVYMYACYLVPHLPLHTTGMHASASNEQMHGSQHASASTTAFHPRAAEVQNADTQVCLVFGCL